MIGATIVVASVWRRRWANFPGIWTTWWLGDLTGALVFAPFLVLWAQPAEPAPERPSFVEVLAIFAAAVVTGTLAFGPVFEHGLYRAPLRFLIIVPLLWAALRAGQRETATVAVILSSTAVWETYLGSGPFVRADVNASFLVLLMFIIIITVPSLTLAAAVAQRRRAEGELRRSHAGLDRLIDERTAELADKERQFRLLVQSVTDYAIYMLDPDGNIRSWNFGAERIKGYCAKEASMNFSAFYTEEERRAGRPQGARRGTPRRRVRAEGSGRARMAAPRGPVSLHLTRTTPARWWLRQGDRDITPQRGPRSGWRSRATPALQAQRWKQSAS